MKELNINYGKRLKKLRKAKNVSQLELEMAAKMSPGVVSRIENGKISPTKETLFKIAQALELDLPQTLHLFGLDMLLPKQISLEFPNFTAKFVMQYKDKR